MNPRFFERDKIAFVMMTKPKSVSVKIGNDNRLRTRNFVFRFKPGDNFGGQKMSADGDVGLFCFEQFDERLSI